MSRTRDKLERLFRPNPRQRSDDSAVSERRVENFPSETPTDTSGQDTTQRPDVTASPEPRKIERQEPSVQADAPPGRSQKPQSDVRAKLARLHKPIANPAKPKPEKPKPAASDERPRTHTTPSPTQSSAAGAARADGHQPRADELRPHSTDRLRVTRDDQPAAPPLPTPRVSNQSVSSALSRGQNIAKRDRDARDSANKPATEHPTRETPQLSEQSLTAWRARRVNDSGNPPHVERHAFNEDPDSQEAELDEIRARLERRRQARSIEPDARAPMLPAKDRSHHLALEALRKRKLDALGQKATTSQQLAAHRSPRAERTVTAENGAGDIPAVPTAASPRSANNGLPDVPVSRLPQTGSARLTENDHPAPTSLDSPLAGPFVPRGPDPVDRAESGSLSLPQRDGGITRSANREAFEAMITRGGAKDEFALRRLEAAIDEGLSYELQSRALRRLISDASRLGCPDVEMRALRRLIGIESEDAEARVALATLLLSDATPVSIALAIEHLEAASRTAPWDRRIREALDFARRDNRA